MAGRMLTDIDLVKELRLRRWARQNYVAPSLRENTWHPVVLDEMQARDAELRELLDDSAIGQRLVPLAPTTQHRVDAAHQSIARPNWLSVPQESFVYIPG